MPKKVLLLRASDGSYEELNVEPPYRKLLGGRAELMLTRTHYMSSSSVTRIISKGVVTPTTTITTKTTRQRILCYANDDAMAQSCPPNPWAELLIALGLYLKPGYDLSSVCGDILLFSEGLGPGDEKDVDPYVVTLVKSMAESGDMDLFLQDFAEKQRAMQSPPPKQPRKRSQPLVVTKRRRRQQQSRTA